MIPLGLNSRELAEFHAVLADSHSIAVTAQLITHTHQHRGDLPRVTDGQVDIDVTGDVCDRSSSITIFDPNYQAGLDAADPAVLIPYPALMVRIKYAVRAARIGADWVVVPAFCGPIVSVDRDGPELTLELQGKETLIRRAIHGARTWPKGYRKSTAIFELLTKVGGESRSYVDIPLLNDRLVAPLTIGPEDDPWALARKLASQVGRNLSYDGRGVATLEKRVTTPVITIRSGPGGLMMAPTVDSSDSITGLVNRVRATSRDKKGKDIAAVAIAPSSHPLSPGRLARNGVGLGWTEEISDDKANTTARAKTLAVDTLDKRLGTDKVTGSVSCLPIPHLEPWDVVRVQSDKVGYNYTVEKATLPLTCSELATVGSTRSVSRKALLRKRK